MTFDCWSTLLYERDPERSFQLRVYGFAELLREHGRPQRPAQVELALREAWQRHSQLWQRGQHSGAREVAAWALARFGIVEPAIAEQLCGLLQRVRDKDAVVALPGALETLAALRERGVSRSLVCDTGLTPGTGVRELLAHTGLLPYLEVLAFSDEVGVPKPDPRPFRAALSPLSVAPEDAVHVGDLRRTDVAGARAVGMGTVRLRAHHDDQADLPEADAVAGSHAVLLRLLGC